MQQTPPPAPTPRPVTIEPVRDHGQVKWLVCDVNASKCGGDGANPASPYPEIILDPDLQYQFTLTIKNPDGIVYAPETGSSNGVKEAFWVKPGKGQHPASSGVNSDGQFVSPQLTDPTTLSFLDVNAKDMWLSYRLNFIDTSNHNRKLKLDPDIKNGGTNTPPPPPPPPTAPSTEKPCGYLGQVAGVDVAALLIGLVIGLIIGIVLCRLRK